MTSDIKRLLNYAPETGIFTWKIGRPGASKGAEAGWVCPRGYRYIIVNRKRWLAHRLAWFFITGELPPDDLDVDHKNTNPSDNRKENLRLASRQNNNRNNIGKPNSTGYKGVARSGKKFYASICVKGGKKTYLGSFPTREEAHAAYVAAAKKHFGEFANAGVN